MIGIAIDKLRRLDTQATAPPWTWEATGDKSNEWCLGTEHEGEVVDFVAQSGLCENLADPALIIALRNALPAITEALDAARVFATCDGSCVTCAQAGEPCARRALGTALAEVAAQLHGITKEREEHRE